MVSTWYTFLGKIRFDLFQYRKMPGGFFQYRKNRFPTFYCTVKIILSYLRHRKKSKWDFPQKYSHGSEAIAGNVTSTLNLIHVVIIQRRFMKFGHLTQKVLDHHRVNFDIDTF